MLYLRMHRKLELALKAKQDKFVKAEKTRFQSKEANLITTKKQALEVDLEQTRQIHDRYMLNT